MKILEMIEELKKIEKAYGDLEVYAFSGVGVFKIKKDEVIVEKPDISDYGYDVDVEKYVVSIN